MIIRRLFLALPLLVLCWVAVLALVMRFSDAAPAAVVILPSADFLQNLPEGVAVLSRTSLSVTLQSDLPGLAKILYHKGATLVLPAGLPGCLPLTATAGVDR